MINGLASAMWRKKLPSEVQRQVASLSLQGEASMKATLNVADSVYMTLQQRGAGARVAAVAVHDPYAFDTSADEPALQVAAVATGRNGRFGQKKPPSRSGGQAGQAPAKGAPHPDGPPPGACNTHYKYGKAAFTCRKKDTCPWASLCPTKK